MYQNISSFIFILDYVVLILLLFVCIFKEWKDHSLSWNKDDYGGIESIHIPAAMIWRPDILLYNK